jgi:hypothetical protein
MSVRQKLIDLKNTAIRPYIVFRRWDPIWKASNRESRQYFEASRPVLTDVQASVVQRLSEDGIAITHLDDLFPGQNVLPEMQSLVQSLEAAPIPNQKKTFLTQLIPLYPILDLTDPFVRFSLSPNVLDCVSSYLEMWPKLYYYTLGVTQPVEMDAVPRQSQCWHRDPEDKKMCKVFLYLTDVDEASGPFTYVKRSTLGHTWGSYYAQKPPHGNYPPDGAVERRIPSEDIQVCTGRAGTIVFADTSGLHKGGYATKNRRIMSTTGFVPQGCTRGVFYTRPTDFAERESSLTPMARYALKNTKIANRKTKY